MILTIKTPQVIQSFIEKSVSLCEIIQVNYMFLDKGFFVSQL